MDKRSGITMLEIVVSMMILALVLVGMVNVFVVSRQYMAHTRSRMAASQMGTVFLDPLQNQVNATNWNTGANNLSVGTRPGPSYQFNNINYTSNYTVTNEGSGASELRKVKVQITWNETQ